jgi:hypothetical protein
MRVALLLLLMCVCGAPPASAQSSDDTWEFGLGPHIVRREDSTTHHGGGITVARRYQSLTAVLEASGTRRHGHNDWRVVVGPRVMLGTTPLFAQLLGGTLIRSNKANWAVLPGGGVDVRWTSSAAVRFQIDALVERSDGRTASSARASVWLVFR